jgi:hypothetical protein
MGQASFGQFLNACGEKREAEKRKAGKLGGTIIYLISSFFMGLKDYHDYLKDLKKIVVIL